MKRRSFIKTAAVTGAAATVAPALSHALPPVKPAQRQFYELRAYTLKDAGQQKLVEDYFAAAAIPALNRYGSHNIGVFTEMNATGQARLFALIPYNDLNSFLNIHDKLAADADYQQKAAPYLSAPTESPAYERMESSLLQAFTGAPLLTPPAQRPRLFELRQYESATEADGKTKIQMFNQEDEMGIFRRLGFKPVFFSETLIGTHRPNLTYMVTFKDMAEHDQLWKDFGADPQWKHASSLPQYPGKIVSHITSTFLGPAACSQI